MAAWIEVFVRTPIEPLSANVVRDGIGAADWWTLGEDWGLSSEDVNEFMAKVRWSDSPLSFGLEGQRQIRITIDSAHEEVRFLVDELVKSRGIEIPQRVRKYLDDCKGIVCLEMGISQLRTMHETIAFEVAYWISEKFDGVILSDDAQWFDHTKNRWKPIAD